MDTISLQGILQAFNAPINEEQSWAVCYQCALFFQKEWERSHCFTFSGLQSLQLSKDGIVTKVNPTSDSKLAKTEFELVQCLGVLIFQALDYGLSETEEHTISPHLEKLIESMTSSGNSSLLSQQSGGEEADEGIAEEGEEEGEDDRVSLAHVMQACCEHLQSQIEPSSHYKAVCRALVAEAIELITFLEKISTDKQKLRSNEDISDGGTTFEELQTADWARIWMQVMRELRTGVMLKKRDCLRLDPGEYELTPYEILMNDIKEKKHNLKHIAVNPNIPQRTKKDAHDIILDFIRSRPPLHPAKNRRLRESPARALDPREKLLLDIRKAPKLKTSSSMREIETSRTRLDERDRNPMPPKKVIKADLNLLDFDNDNSDYESSSEEELEDRNKVSPCPFSPITPLSPHAAAALAATHGGSWQQTVPPPQGRTTRSNSSSTGGSSPSSHPSSPRLLRQRNSIAVCESPTYNKPPPIKPSLVPAVGSSTRSNSSGNGGSNTRPRSALLQRGESLLRKLPPSLERRLRPFTTVSEEPNKASNKESPSDSSSTTSSTPRSIKSSLECLSLTVEEVMHIRNVLTKSELESLLVHKELHDQVEKGKVCFTCLKTKFSLFGPWSTKCKFCQRNVCSRCVSKMRIPTEHFENIPVYTLSPSPVSQESATDLHIYEKTGSAPNSPEHHRKRFNFPSNSSPSSTTTSSSKDSTPLNNNNSLKQARFSHSPGISPSSTVSHCSDNSSSNDVAGSKTRKRVGRSATVRQPATEKPSLQGPIMSICKDCRAMVLNIIKGSRMSFNVEPNVSKVSTVGVTARRKFGTLPKSAALARQQQNRSEGGKQNEEITKTKREFRLDLKPVYKENRGASVRE